MSTPSATRRPFERRQDIQLQKFFAPFSGWFLTPKMRYYLYVWSSNASQGDPDAGRWGGQPDVDLQPVRERPGLSASPHCPPCEAQKVSSHTGSAWTTV